MDDFILKIITRLDASKTADDLKKIEKQLNANGIKLKPVIDTVTTKKEIQNLANQMKDILEQINPKFGDFGTKKIESAIKEVMNFTRKAAAEQERISSQILTFDSRRASTVQGISVYLKQNKKLSTENTQEAGQLYHEILRIQDAMRALNTNDAEFSSQFTGLSNELTTAKRKAKELGLTGKSAAEHIKEMFNKFTGLFPVSQMVMFAINKFREAGTELKEIDSTLTEISKTSNRTAKELKALGDTSFETASRYGVKANDYLVGVQEMSRAGYENSEEMAELSIMAQSAGDMSKTLANDYLIASDAAFGYGGNIKKLTELLDGQNQVTNRNAVSMEELANSTKVAGSLLANVASIPENEMTALLGTGIASSRESGETVARAVKSIIMNLHQVAGEGGFDGEIIDEEGLKKVEARCHSVGVELEYMKDGIASLRDPIDVLRDLSNVYNSLPENSAERAGIISDIGGKYRGNVLSSILSNWDNFDKMLQDYEHSSGSAFEESMKSASNMEGSLNRLSNTWVDTVHNIADSDGIINTVNLLNGLLEIINKITGALGAAGTAGLIGGSVLGAKGLGQLVYLLHNCGAHGCEAQVGLYYCYG